ncbi:MAG: LPXTG cell wall anchor domain-containing protein, partial [Coriobacteriia bacterium]|nr:LPXTG cell wall anchor domain-containing protein [Coriobacteriia bacterium]
TATPKSYTGYTYSPGYDKNGNTEVASGTIAPDGSLVLKLYYTEVVPNAVPVYTVKIRYHLWTADGEVIKTVSVPGTWKPGDVIDPTAFLNAYKQAGFGNGVPVGSNWKVSATGSNVFDIYYPDTPPVINVENDVIYVRKPVELTLEDILRLAGVTITDAEEDIPLSKLLVSGYPGITWTKVNYPGGVGYVIRLNVSDTPGLAAAYREITVFVMDQSENIRKPKPGETPPAVKPPKGTEWGIDKNGDWVIYIPNAPVKTPAGSSLPKTGDSIAIATPLALIVAALAIVFKRRRRATNFGD